MATIENSIQNQVARNFLLASMEPDTLAGVLTALEPRPLVLHQELMRFDEAINGIYFMTTGIASTTVPLSDGSTVEISIVGNDTAAGISLLTGGPEAAWDTVVQVPGCALFMLEKDALHLFNSDHNFRCVMLDAMRRQWMQTAQVAACNTLHLAEPRLARWLSMMRDRHISNELPLTQEFLASMLGARRATVTVAAASLQAKGLIRTSRGTIHLIDREGLRRAACECYMRLRGMRTEPVEC